MPLPGVSTAELDRERLVDEVVADYLLAARAGKAPSRNTLLAQYPQLAQELASFFADTDEIERLAAPLRQALPAAPSLTTGARLGDYELIEEIAQGGMGVVWRARQLSLDRVVAVKFLRAGPLASRAEWDRFRVEARAVAALDHPNIVPVYEVGEHEGVPFFSMKLVEGGSLSGVRLAEGEGPRAAARLLATVARAVGHAHERGVLHRDLKPANVLLAGKPGEWQPVVTDFGLAKRSIALPSPAEQSGAAPELTAVGSVVGTPSYMAPEQARGESPTVATDVYGLGAIFYELLTARPPFQGSDTAEVLRRVRDEAPTPPHLIDPRADRDLEAICLVCLSKEAAARYPSARALADDLERYLAGQPVSVRPVGRTRRLVLWCRRQPLVAALVSLLAIVFVTAFVLVLGQWRTAVKERDRAEANLDRLQEVLDNSCDRLSEQQLAAVPGLQKVRKDVLDAALKHYQELLAQRPGNAGLRAKVAGTYLRIATLTNAVGSRADALVACQKARELYEALCAQGPESAEVRLQLARALHREGQLQSELGKAAQAMTAFDAAGTVLADLSDDAEQGTTARREMTALCTHVGNLHKGAGRYKEARQAYEQGVRACEELLRSSPGSQWVRYSQAVALDNLGSVLTAPNEQAEKERCYKHSRALLEQLDHDGADQAVQVALAKSDLREGNVLCLAHEYDKALDVLAKGRERLARLVHDNPHVLPYQDDLAMICRQMGHAHRGRNRLSEAARYYQEALDRNDRLHHADPSSLAYRRGLARSCFDLGTVEDRLGRRQDAVASYMQARDHYRRLTAAEPSSVDYCRSILMTLNNLTLLLRDDKPEEALAMAHESRDIARAAFARSPEIVEFRQLLSTNCRMLTALERKAGRPEAAAEVALAWVPLYAERPDHLVHCARALALAADAVGPGASASEQAARDGWRERAVQLVAEAASKALPNLGKMVEDEAFRGLRQREDFRKVLQGVKATPGPGTPGGRVGGHPVDRP